MAKVVRFVGSLIKGIFVKPVPPKSLTFEEALDKVMKDHDILWRNLAK